MVCQAEKLMLESFHLLVLAHGGSSPYLLQQTKLPILPADYCSAAISQYDPQTMICAGYKEGGKSTCQVWTPVSLTVQLGKYFLHRVPPVARWFAKRKRMDGVRNNKHGY